MTAEPDALRLVPVEPTRQMINAARVTFRNSSWHELSPSDIDRNVGTGAFREAWGAMLAASPAVQPAAGRATIEFLTENVSDETMRALLLCKDVGSGRAHLASILAAISTPAQASGEPVAWQRLHPTHGWRDMDAEDVDHYRAQGQQIRPLYAHPPAQASESGGEPEWVVNDIAELGVKIGDRFFWLHKGQSLVYGTEGDDVKNGIVQHDEGGDMHWRPVFKREFGECAHPINYADPTRIGTVSLDDSDDWKPLPAALSAPQAAPGEGEGES